MTSAARSLLLALAMFCTTLTVFAQAQTRTATPADAGTVTGKVSIKGKPAPGVVVTLRRIEMSNPYENLPQATTDRDGAYRVTGVSPGNYQVTAVAPAFVVADVGQRYSRTVALTAGETVEDINFSIVRGGVITGKVTDAEGRPVIEQQVYIYRTDAFNQQPSQPQRQISQSDSGTTDDRGIYRIFGIAAGQYKVAVGRGEDALSGSLAVGRTSYQRVFHPNVSDQTKATLVEVSEGSEAIGVDISLGPPLQTFTAAGRTVDGEKFMPMPNVRFQLQRISGESTEFMNTLLSSNSQGDFVIERLLPGKYAVSLLPEPNNSLRADTMDFEVVDHDVAGLTIKLTRGAGISGTVVLETDDKRALAKLSQMRIAAFVMNPSGGPALGQSISSTIAPDGSFNISGLPAGTANIISGMFWQDDSIRLFVSRIERDGIVQPRGIEIKDGEQIAGVRVVVGYGTATLRGVVNLLNGELPAGGSIFVRIGRPGDTSFTVRPPQVDARGHFVSQRIPAGVYELSVSVSGPGIKPRSTKQQVTLQDGAATDVVVTIDLAAGTKP